MSLQLSNFKLPLIVFCSGAILMIYELVGTRVTAPLVGNSLYTWTAIIGTILGCLSLGNYWGGVLADRFAHIKILSYILLWAAFFVGLTNSISDLLNFYLFNLNLIPEIKTTFFALVLFGPSAVFLGMVSPFAMKLTLTSLKQTGKQAGILYMLSTMGSILGTFLAGFLLIPTLGTEQLIIALSLSLIGLSLITFKKLNLFKVIFIGVIITVLLMRYFEFKNNRLMDFDTVYQRVRIYHFNYLENNKPVVAMTFDSKGVQSLKYIDSYKLASDYTQVMQAYKSVIDPPKSALFIGGAGYVLPSYLYHTNSKVQIEVVEIDSQITKLAKDYFGLVENPRLVSIHTDGRLYTANTDKKYDLIMLDAFGGEGLVPPFHLITKEAFELTKHILADNGVLVVNIISPLTGNNQLFGSVYKTINNVFADVLILGTMPDQPSTNQNIILVAGNTKLNFDENKNYEYSALVKESLWDQIPSSDLVLTDNYAPIEYLERQGRSRW